MIDPKDYDLPLEGISLGSKASTPASSTGWIFGLTRKKLPKTGIDIHRVRLKIEGYKAVPFHPFRSSDHAS